MINYVKGEKVMLILIKKAVKVLIFFSIFVKIEKSFKKSGKVSD